MALKGEPSYGWMAIRCHSCTKQIWREKKTSTRETIQHVDQCITCHRNETRRSTGAQSPQRPSSTASESIHARPVFTQPSSEVLDDLGISMETFRALRLLQMREINENDYDLLMRLNSKPACKVRSLSCPARPQTTPAQ